MNYDFTIVDPQQVFESTHAHNGIASMAAAWKEQGKIVKIIDYAKREYPKDRHLRLVGKTAHFGVSVKTVTYDCSQQITKSFATRAKELGVRDATKILWGGAHVTERMETQDKTIKGLPWTFNEDTKSAQERMFRENPEVDHFIPGEAEYWPENDEKRFDLDALPFPDYTDFDSYENLVDGWRRGRLVWGVISSRGCPFLVFLLYRAARFGKSLETSLHRELHGRNNVHVDEISIPHVRSRRRRIQRSAGEREGRRAGASEGILQGSS